jgi:dihydrofolate reductase
MSQYDQPVSGSDIYHKLGALEGKVDALIARTSEYRLDLQTAFDRITAIENRQAWIMGGAVVISAIMPIIVQYFLSNTHPRLDPKRSADIAFNIKNI